jgi:hypothetical protein
MAAAASGDARNSIKALAAPGDVAPAPGTADKWVVSCSSAGNGRTHHRMI